MDEKNMQGGGRNAAYFLLLVSFYWTSQVIKNIVHVTTAGTFASWYFLYPQNMPSNPTVGALKRATWTSFGSICLGSLIIAVVKALREIAENGRRSRNGFVRCCIICVLNCLENLITYFNVYAFTHVAIYGSTYCQAAQQTWDLIKGRGFDMLINDNLIGGVLFLGCLIVGFVTAGVAVLIGHLAWKLEYWYLFAFLGLFVGLAISICTLEVVESSVAACFVCFAEDPAALQRTKPDEYNRLNAAFHNRMGELQARERDDQANNQQ